MIDPMYQKLAEVDDLAKRVEDMLRTWLSANIDWPDAMPMADARRVMDDLVDELFTAGFSPAIDAAWPAIEKWLCLSAEGKKVANASGDL